MSGTRNDASRSARHPASGPAPKPEIAGPRLRRWPGIVGLVVGVALFAVLIGVLVSRWRQLPPEAVRLNWWTLVAAFVLMQGQNVLAALQWRSFVRAVGGDLSVVEAMFTYYIALLGRYVPGKVFLLVGKVYLTRRQGVPVGTAALAVGYEQALHVLSAGFVVLFAVLSAGLPALAPYRLAMLVACLGGGACLHPRVIGLFLRAISRFRPGAGELRGLPGGLVAWFTVRYGLLWCVSGSIFYLLARSLHPLPLRYLPDCVGIMALSSIAALLALITPGGLGVREAAVSVALSAYMPLPLAVAVSLVQRVVGVTSLLTSALVALALRPRCRAHAARRAERAAGPVDPSAAPVSSFDNEDEQCPV